jgi:hypothetical protein
MEARMAITFPPEVDRQYPTEQIQFAVDGAEEEADWVGVFLTAAGVVPGESRGFPPGLLLDLGGMTRLRAWEEAGLDVHLQAGLPDAHRALEHIIDILISAAKNPAEIARAGHIGRAVFDLRMNRFAWAGPVELQVDVALDNIEEDTLIAALADLLWAARPRQTAQ